MSNEIDLLVATLEAHKRGLQGTSLATLLLILNEPVCLSKLAKILKVSNPSITGTADRLEKQGYITREAYAHDKRKTALVITNKGIAAIEYITNEQ